MFDFDELKKSLLSIVTTNLSAAKDEIEKYINSKKADYVQWSNDVLNGNMSKDELEELVKGEKDSIEIILLKYAMKGQMQAQEQAKKTAIDIAGILLNVLIKSL
jgi:hypothetical protein